MKLKVAGPLNPTPGTSNSEDKAVALEPNNTAFEFETMLRRHLSRGGSMVEACTGFDADTASAYLENVLGQMTRSRYESHLAGCPSCRRHIIELSRLIHVLPTIPQPNIQPVPAGKPIGTLSQWKSAAAGWFDLSAWNPLDWNWGWATAGTAAAVLLAVVATQSWRQSQPAQLALAPAISNVVPNASPIVALTADSQKAVPTEALVAGNDLTKQPQLMMHTAVPPPGAVTPNPGDPALPLSLGASAKTIEAGKELPPTTVSIAPGISPVITSFGANLGNSQPAIHFDAPPAPAPEKTDAVATVETAKIIAPLNPSPSDNPMTRSRNPKPTPTPRTWGSFSFLPSHKEEAGRKPELKEIEENAPKLLTVRVHDKVFSFQSGIWVDHDYKPDMAWRVTKLVRDSEEYKQVLAAEPQIKEFFERNSVIVVWKDKIYKVVSK